MQVIFSFYSKQNHEMEFTGSTKHSGCDEKEYLRRLKDEYKNLVSIPMPIAMNVVGEDPGNKDITIATKWQQEDLETYTRRHFETFSVLHANDDIKASSVSECFPLESSGVVLERISPSLRLKAIIRKVISGGSNDFEYVCEIWGMEGQKMIQSVNLTRLDKHGRVHSEVWFAGLSWSPDETKLLYVAERSNKKMKTPFEYYNDECYLSYDKFKFVEDWKEENREISDPALCVLDLSSEIVTIIPNIPDHLSPGQPQWGLNGSIIFVGWCNTPYKSGLAFCTNKKSGLYLITKASKNLEEIAVSCHHDEIFVASPRMNLQSNKLVFLYRKLSGKGDAHMTSVNLAVYDFHHKSLSISPPNMQYNGKNILLYVLCQEDVPAAVWLSDGKHICLPTFVDGDSFLCIIDTFNFQIKYMTPCTKCFGVYNDVIITCSSDLGTTCVELKCLKVALLNQSLEVRHITLGSPRKKERDFKVGFIDDVPNVPKSPYIIPSVSLAETESGLIPVIVYVHGGPHLLSNNKFNKFAQGYCRAGFACLLPNYRGSVGFGNSSLYALPGKIGEMDVIDVHATVERFLEKFENVVDPRRIYLYGGSHGGFICIHLISKYPDFYRACAMRNPLVNIAAKVSDLGVPSDSSYYQCGLTFRPDTIPSAEAYTAMLSRSPIRFVESIKAPILILIAELDNVLSPSQGLSLSKALKAYEKDHKVLLYKNEVHTLSKVETEADVFMNICLYFFRYM